MKHILLLGLILTTVSTVHGMQHKKNTQNTTQDKTQNKIKKNQLQRNEEIHNLFTEGRHKEAQKKLPSKMASLVQYSQTANDPQFKLWVEARTKNS